MQRNDESRDDKAAFEAIVQSTTPEGTMTTRRSCWSGNWVRTLASLAVMAAFGLAMLGSSEDDLNPWDNTVIAALLPLATLWFHGTGTVLQPGSGSNPNGTARVMTARGSSAGAISGAATSVGLSRQANCSITEYGFAYASGTNTSGTVTVSTATNFGATLRTDAGLTTTTGTWPNGCKDQELGIPSRYAASLGLTKDGSSQIAAYVDYNNNLYVSTVNPTTGAYVNTEVLTGTAIALVAADIEGTGYPDLLVQTFSSGGSAEPIAIYHNNGDGTFKAGATELSGISTSGFTVDDVNGDSKLDLIVTGPTGIIVLPGNGNGTFGSSITSTVTLSLDSGVMATGDFNGDGKKDLALGTGAILLGDGAGHFTAATSSITISANGLVVGDWNNDGKQDLAFMQTGTSGGLVTVYLGAGNGLFTQGNSYVTIGGTFMLSAGDLDGDGNLDITVGEANGGLYGPDFNSAGSFQALMGNGDGTFAGAEAYSNGGYDSNASAASSPVAVADFHGTGHQDVLMVTNTDLELLTNNGTGALTASTGISGTTPTQVVTADMNGDGKPDAVFVEGSSSSGDYDVAVALGQGSGEFATKTTTSLAGAATHIVTGNFNGDGKPDVAVAVGNEVYLLLNEGNGTLAAPLLVATENDPITGLAASSLRSNGKLDLVVTEAQFNNPTEPGEVGILLGNGNGTFATQSNIALDYLPSALAVGDMNNDGVPDLVVASSDQYQSTYNLYVAPGKGDGTFGSVVTTALSFPYVSSIALAHLNGDYNTDVVINSCCGGTQTWLALGSGNGSFSTVGSLTLGASATSVAVADLNGDGYPDILLNSSSAASALDVLLSQTPGHATMTSPTPGSVLSGSSATFSWTPATGATLYKLFLGSTGPGSSNLYDSGHITASSATVTGLPTNGETVYAELWSYVNNVWMIANYTYTAGSATPVAKLSATSLSFPSTQVGSTASLPLTITNSGSGTLNVSAIGSTGTNASLFTHTSNCGGNPLAAGQSCTAQVTFTPAAAGSFTATLNITDNATGSPQTVALTGTATAGPTVTLSTTSLSFPATQVGSTSTLPLTITNSGNGTLHIVAITSTGVYADQFTHTSTCGGSELTHGQSCSAQVMFTPNVTGAYGGSLTITDNATGAPQYVDLTGTAVAGPASSISPFSLTFPTTTIGSTSTLPLTITNIGSGTLNVTAISSTGSNASYFTHTSNCGGNPLAQGASCTVQVTFKPTAAVSLGATLTIADNEISSPKTVALTGTGTTAAPAAKLSATSLSFPSTQVGSTSTLPLTITNSGGGTLSVSAISSTGANASLFTHTSNCGGNPLAAGASCTAQVIFSPTAAGSFTATLNITDNATGSPQTVTLTATGH